MRKLLIAITATLMLVAALPAMALADDSGDGTVYTQGTLYYTISNQSATITGCFGRDAEVTVPNQIAGIPVNVIASGAFASNSHVKKVTLPDTITSVEEGAFAEGITVVFSDGTTVDGGTSGGGAGSSGTSGTGSASAGSSSGSGSSGATGGSANATNGSFDEANVTLDDATNANASGSGNGANAQDGQNGGVPWVPIVIVVIVVVAAGAAAGTAIARKTQASSKKDADTNTHA